MNDGKVEEGLTRFHYDKTSVKNQNMRIKTITNWLSVEYLTPKYVSTSK